MPIQLCALLIIIALWPRINVFQLLIKMYYSLCSLNRISQTFHCHWMHNQLTSKFILLSRYILNWSKVTVKTSTTLDFYFLFWKKSMYTKIKLVSTLVIMRNVSWAENQHIRVISEALHDTEDWSNDAENSALHHRNIYIIYIYTHIRIMYVCMYYIYIYI